MDTSFQRTFIANLAGDAAQLASVAPRLQRGLGNVVSGVVDQLSTSPLDFVYQLLQNADDKEFAPGVIPEVGFVIKPERGGFVHAWDNGLPMTKEQVEAMVTFRSTKRGDNETIGEKGVGWHSVFRVSHAPHVFSGGFSFKLGSDGLESIFTPEWVENEDLPFQPQGGTNFYLPLRELDDSTLQGLANLRDNFSPKTLLFLRKVRRVRIEPQRFSVELDGDISTLRVSASKSKCEKAVESVIVVRPPASDVPSDISSRDPRIVLAFPLQSAGLQNVFAWLPVMASGLKFLLHADFVTTLSREGLLANEWNSWLWRQLPTALALAIEQLTCSMEAPLASTWPDLWPTDKVHIPELYAAILAAETVLQTRPVVATLAGFRPPNVCVLAEEDERTILPASELSGIGRYYPVHRDGQVLVRFGAVVFTPDLFREYVAKRRNALLLRYDVEEELLDRVVHYLQRHDVGDIPCLPIATRNGPELQAPADQLVAVAHEQVAQLSEMGLAVVRVNVGAAACAWLTGLGLRRATPEAVLETILSTQEAETDPEVSVLQLHYLHSILEQLPGPSRVRLSNELLVFTDSGDEGSDHSGPVRLPIQQTHIRDKTLMDLFEASPSSPAPASVRFMSSIYNQLGANALEKLGAWTTIRLEERSVEVPFAHRSHPMMDRWLETEKLPTTANTYKFEYWVLPDDVCKCMTRATASVKTAFLEVVASHWETYEACRMLRVHHTWRSKRFCTHGLNSCEQCTFSREQKWELAPFLASIRAMHVPTTDDSLRPLDQTILLPARERARLCGLHLPLPGLAADIDNTRFLSACGVATEVSADILLRGLLQLRERPINDEVLRQVQAFYGLLERVTSEDAFTLTGDWPILACDPCPTELERRALAAKMEEGGDWQERQAGLQSKMLKSLRWFALKDVRWEGPARIVQGRFALLSTQRTPDARRVYSRLVADMLRAPDVGPSDLIDVLDGLADKGILKPDKVDIVVRIYEQLALATRTNSLDEGLLSRLRRRFLTHRHVFVSGLVFACDNVQDLGLADNKDVHFLHFPQAVASHPGFLAQLRIPLAKDGIKTTYVGQVGTVDRSATDAVRSKLEWLVRAVVHLLPEARNVSASDWGSVGEFARVEVVPEVMVQVELGAAQTTRRMRHAVDWSQQRCAVVLSQEHRTANSSRSQRLLTAGVADLLAVVSGTSASTELVRLVGLILATPHQELDDLAEDERLPRLPSRVKGSLGQSELKTPATLLAPLVEEGGDPGPPQDVEQTGIDCHNNAEPVLEEGVNDGIEPPDAVTKDALPMTPVDGPSRHQNVSLEAARLRVEAALARGDAGEARSALAEHPLPLDEDLEERVEILVEQDSLVTALRDTARRVHELGVESLRQVCHRAEIDEVGRRSMPVLQALSEARKCMQDVDREARRSEALSKLGECRALDRGDGVPIKEVEIVIMEAWEAGVDQTHPDFLWASMQVESERLRLASEAVEAALQGDAAALASSVASLKHQLARGGAPEDKRKQGMRTLKRVKLHQSITHELSSALVHMDAASVQNILEQARTVPLAASLVGQAEMWLAQRENLESHRSCALERLSNACDVVELGYALCAARECCYPDDLAPFEQLFQDSSATAEQARVALREAHNVELLHEVVSFLPPGMLPAEEVDHWNAVLQNWVAHAATAATAFYSSPKEVGILQLALQHAVNAGVGPQALEAMQQVLQSLQLNEAIDEADMQTRQREELQVQLLSWQREHQSAAWRKYLAEENNLTLEGMQSAVAFARDACDEGLSMMAQVLLEKVGKAGEYWQRAEKSGFAADWKLAAAACRSCRQLRRSEDADARARSAQAREDTERQLAEAADEEQLFPALQRAQELRMPEASLAAPQNRLLRSFQQASKPSKLPNLHGPSNQSFKQPDCVRAPQRVLPGEYKVKLLGKWEQVSSYGAEALTELGLLDKNGKAFLGPTELPVHVVTQPHGYAPVEGDVLGDRMRRVEEKLAHVRELEEKILRKEKLSKEDWHSVAHKALHTHELRRLQAKLMSSGAERVQFTEVWEAVDIVNGAGCDPFGRHLLEGAPAEPQKGWAPPSREKRERPGDVGKRIGALGELYVFTWLEKLVEGFGFDNWTSSCRAVHPDAPHCEEDIDTAGYDFRFYDHAGLFCHQREILIEVKSLRVQGDPANTRVSDFTCHLSSNELSVMKRASESDMEYYMLLWVVVGDNLECRVVAMLRQPYDLLPEQLSLQPTSYIASLNQSFAPPGLELPDED